MDALLNILDPLYFYLDLTTNYGTIVQIKNTCTETHAAISAYEIKYKHYLLSLPLGRGLTIKFGVKAVNVYEDPRAPPVRRCIHAVAILSPRTSTPTSGWPTSSPAQKLRALAQR